MYILQSGEIKKGTEKVTIVNGKQYPPQMYKDGTLRESLGIRKYELVRESFNTKYYWDGQTVRTETDTTVTDTITRGEPRLVDDRLEVNEDGTPMLDQDGNQVVTRGLKHTTSQKLETMCDNYITSSELADYELELLQLTVALNKERLLTLLNSVTTLEELMEFDKSIESEKFNVEIESKSPEVTAELDRFTANYVKNKALDELVITHNTVAYDAHGRAIGNMSAVMGVANFKYNQAVSQGMSPVSAYQMIYKDTKIFWKGADDKPHEVMIESVCEALEKSMLEVANIIGV